MREKEKRSCSMLKPIAYQAVELLAVFLAVYLVTLGDPFCKFGILSLLIGGGLSLGKLPRYFNRARTCQRYEAT